MTHCLAMPVTTAWMVATVMMRPLAGLGQIRLSAASAMTVFLVTRVQTVWMVAMAVTP